MSVRKDWIDPEEALSLSRQCALANISRSCAYQIRKAKMISESELEIRKHIDEHYTQYPFCGSRRICLSLRARGYRINRKRVQRLMREMGLAGMAPGPNTSKPQLGHKTYPYLLRGVAITRVNQVWSTDITYIRLGKGFAYLVVILDWYSRQVLSWRVSSSMDTLFCIDCLEQALTEYGKPEVFNSDQGSQFTSSAFTDILKAKGIAISMDGRGRAFDNIFVERLWRSVKYEDIYLQGYATMQELSLGLSSYFAYYNADRPHQALGNNTPNSVHESGTGGGAMIMDKYPKEAQNQKSRQHGENAEDVGAIV